MKRKQSKAAFIRSLPGDTPAAEVVKQGKAAGLRFTTNYVHSQRARAELRAVAAPNVPIRDELHKPSPVASLFDWKVSRPASAERVKLHGDARRILLAVVAVLGIDNAATIIEDERERIVRELLGGGK